VTTVLKNVLNFSGLVVGTPLSIPHLLNVNGVAVAPELVIASAGGYTLAVDTNNVTVTRGTSGGASVNIYVERWHTFEDSEPPGGLGSLVPFFVEGATIGLVVTDGVTIQGDGSAANPVAIEQVQHDGTMAGAGTVASPLGVVATTPAVVFNTNQAAGGVVQNNASGNAAAGVNALALGNNCNASGLNATAIGDRCTASAKDAVAIGNQCTASNEGAVALGEGSVASGLGSAAIGDGCQATALDSTALGSGSVASAQAAFAAGDGSIASQLGAFAGNTGQASGTYATAFGDSFATADLAFASGSLGNASRQTQRSTSSGRFAVRGDAQSSEIVLRGSTPGLAMGESVELKFGEAGDQQFTIPSGSFRSFMAIYEVIATGISSGGSGPINLASFKQTLVFHENGGGVVTQDVSGTQEKLTSAGAASWTFAASVPGGPFRLALTFTTGTTTLKTRVVAHLRFVELVPPT